MKFRILKLPQNRRTEAVLLMARAYRNDPSMVFFSYGVAPTKIEPTLVRYFEVLLWLGLKSGIVLAAFSDNALAGVRIFYPPGNYPSPAFRRCMALIKLVFLFVPLFGMKRFFSLLQIVASLEKRHPAASHYYSEITCVEPRFQRQGIATEFSNHLFQLADKDRVGIYIETSNPNNIIIWEKLGYRVKWKHEILGVTYWGFWRDPI